MAKNKKRATVNRHKTGKNTGLVKSAEAMFEKGDISSAKKILKKVIKSDPLNVDALFNLGNIQKAQGEFEKALVNYNTVLSIDPAYVNAHFNIGGIYIDTGEYEAAEKIFLKVISLSPEYTNAFHNLAIVVAALGRHMEAINYYNKVISIDPKYKLARYNAGCILLNLGKDREAVDSFKKELEINPGHTDSLFNIAVVIEKKDVREANKCFKNILEVNPGYFLALNKLGLYYQAEKNHEKAIEYFKKSALANPGEKAGQYVNIGNSYRDMGNAEKTLEYYKKSISTEPSVVGYANLIGYQKELCGYSEAYDLTKKVLEYDNLQKADLANIHDTYIQICKWDEASEVIERFRRSESNSDMKDVLAGSFMEFCAITDLSLDEISELHKEWGKLTEEKVEPFFHDREKLRQRGKKKIRIGYLSPDFVKHSVGYLIKDIISSHNHNDFEIYCYANISPEKCDAFTQEIINSSDMFKYVKHQTDKQVAEEILNDKIDILIELAGHTAGHRLRSLVYKPAPVQITYLGYPNTTGVSRIDYRISDQFAESEEDKDYRYSEKLIRLTNCFLTFKGFKSVVPEDIKESGRDNIILGCFNNIQKLTPTAVKLWAKILHEAEGSKLHLKAKQLNTSFVWDNIVKEFSKHGISEDRLECLGYAPTRKDHLKLYNSIDICLDTFPYNGTVTTLEALWMNMPVVTLVGESHAQRVGYSILKNLGLDELIAFTEDEYVAKTVELAKNPEKIKNLKTKMRKNLLASSICNPIVFTRELELSLKKIWMEYIEGRTEEKGHRTEGKGIRTEGEEGLRTEGERVRTEDAFASAISDTSRLRMAMVKLSAGEFDQAIDISAKLIGRNGITPIAWYVLGIAKYRLGKIAEAIHALNESIKLNPQNTEAWKVLGEIYLVIGKYDKANECLKKVITLRKCRSKNIKNETKNDSIEKISDTQLKENREHKPTIRIFHQMARSGGTVVSKCLGSMKPVTLLSEVHPLKINELDPLEQADQWFGLLKPGDKKSFVKKSTEEFIEAVELINNRSCENNTSLVLRDWNHIDFTSPLSDDTLSYSLSTVETLKNSFSIINTALVRHPIDQWLSLNKIVAIQWDSITLNDFLKGFLRFAEHCSEIGFIRYEDFTKDPEKQMNQLCKNLKVDYDSGFMKKWTDYKTISGDIHGAGRGKSEIMPLPRREISPDLLADFENNHEYIKILDILGYQHPN